MTADDQSIVESQDDGTLAQWWCALNRWEWPAGLAEYRPDNRRSQIMRHIEGKIGNRACLREWNRERMNDDEFASFYDRGR